MTPILIMPSTAAWAVGWSTRSPAVEPTNSTAAPSSMLRNGDLNARNFFAATHDTLNRNQFGVSLGAPIQKDKTFAFFSFQRTTLRYGTTTNVAFGPTAAELNGDWSAIHTQLYTHTVLTRGANALPLTFTTYEDLGECLFRATRCPCRFTFLSL